MNQKKLYFSSLLLLFLVSCGYDPYGNNLTIENPNVSDIAGDYIVKECFLPSDKEADQIKTIVTLNADGSFVGEMIPTMESADLPTNFLSSLKSSSGSWSIEPTGSLGASNKQIWGIAFKSDQAHFLNASLLGNPKPNGIIFQFGDPDSGYAITLRRIK